MPLPTLEYILHNGPPDWVPDWAINPWNILGALGTTGSLYLLKLWCNGFLNPAERDMHGRVILITGGTSGIGAAVVRDLATRGAQVVLLCRLPPTNPFLADYIGNLREETNNQMIYTEQVDLSSLHSIRQFATKWIDNAPPRRLDMLILCAATMTAPGNPRVETEEGIEETWMVNYLANFHLLGILSPALRAQPFDRDVRVIIPTCPSYKWSPPLAEALDKKQWTPSRAYARSKLALMVFGQAFQKHLDAYKRPDGLPSTARVIFCDTGFSRTPGMRRWLSRGTLWGLFLYVCTYAFAWILLKSPEMGAQSILYAALEASLVKGSGGQLIKECQETEYAKDDVKDEKIAQSLWESSDKLIETTEKKSAAQRALQKKEEEAKEEKRKEAEKAEEVESLANDIRKNKEEGKKSRRRTKKAT